MSHKHLGVTLSSDAKWNNHIENIILNVSRHLGILRKLKYRLSRQNLEKTLLCIYAPNFFNMPVKYGIIVECVIQPNLKNCKQITQSVSRNIFIMVPAYLILFLLIFVTRIPF